MTKLARVYMSASEAPPRAGLGDAASANAAIQSDINRIDNYLAAQLVGNATIEQLQDAQAALTDMQGQLTTITAICQPPAANAPAKDNTKMWVSGTAATAVAAGTGIVGGLVGYWLRGAGRKKSR